MRLTIEQYAHKYKMSKEMVHSKLRSKKLNYIVDGNTTYIVIPDPQPQQQEEKKETKKTKITVATLIELYKKENASLKEKIKELEAKIDKLIDDKEQMLKEERERIEKVYAAKDEQLKTVLELISTKLELQKQEQKNNLQHSQTDSSYLSYRVELKEYLKSLDLEPHQRKIIKKRFQEAKGADIRIQEQNGKIYLDFNKYDYSDLLTL
ncbi:MAG: hypothetical protein GXO11_04500 [Epsilonproteobacteria bacterium]|nr:hypothetical protein [Campylobacterota bacterium]